MLNVVNVISADGAFESTCIFIRLLGVGALANYIVNEVQECISTLQGGKTLR